MKYTVREHGFLLWEYYRFRMNALERKILGGILDGIRGLHTEENPLTDELIKTYLSEKQVAFIKRLGVKFRITKKV